MADIEKVEYKPISVRDLLIEVKDISELMIDLAYSAALFDNEELAEEVMDLESQVKTLTYLINMNAMLAARDAEDAEALVGVPMVASSAEKISDAAADIATIVLKDIRIHPIIRDVFRKVEEQLARIKIESTSFLISKRIDELKLAAEIGVNILAMRRGKRWILDPEDEEIIQEEDILIVRGTQKGIEELGKAAKGKLKEL
ncbi:MAG: hypothetical protein NWF08_02735 [Candidatus Bathyarchaeota archaeon]|nr:hypothetical protein [Candidatus Bathyarchaeota archaeon]